MSFLFWPEATRKLNTSPRNKRSQAPLIKHFHTIHRAPRVLGPPALSSPRRSRALSAFGSPMLSGPRRSRVAGALEPSNTAGPAVRSLF